MERLHNTISIISLIGMISGLFIKEYSIILACGFLYLGEN